MKTNHLRNIRKLFLRGLGERQIVAAKKKESDFASGRTRTQDGVREVDRHKANVANRVRKAREQSAKSEGEKGLTSSSKPNANTLCQQISCVSTSKIGTANSISAM